MNRKRELRALAHHLKPIIQVGQKGLTDSLVSAIDQALTDHELLKIRFMDFKEDKKDISKIIEEKTSGELVGIIGNVATFYRESPLEEKRKNFFSEFITSVL